MENDTQIFLSVIIPCYNTDNKFLLECVQSILKQSFCDFEVLIVDDGSDLEHHKYIESILSIDSRLHLITLKNGGVSNARNVGVENSNGKYICFVDSDDVIFPNYFQHAYNIACRENADLVIGGVINSTSSLKISDIENKKTPDFKIYNDDKTKKLIKFFIGPENRITVTNGSITRGPVARLVKKSIIKKIKFDPNLAIGEDLVWNLDVLSTGCKVCIVDEIWYYYRLNLNSATNGFNKKIFLNWKNQLIESYNRINIDDSEIACIYGTHIFEGIRKVWDCYLKYDVNGIEQKKIEREIYTEFPWNILSDYRVYNEFSSKNKIKYFLYKYRILFTSYRVVDKLKSIV